jgi:hypothetical protein
LKVQLQDCCLTAGIENGYAELLSVRYASRNRILLEVVSKVVLRHPDLKTTQMYLGRISEAESLHWMDLLHGK